MTTAHEPRRGPGTHLSAEDLSALAEGAQPSAADAGEHILECAACRGEVDAISELLARFEEWDAPAIPREVAIRIDAALARESAARAETLGAATGSANAVQSASATASRPRRRRWAPSPVFTWALASLVVIAGAVGLVLKLASTSTTNATASSASGAVSSGAQPDAGTNNGALSGGQGQGAARAPALAAPNSQIAAWTRQVLAPSYGKFAVPLDSNAPCLSDPALGGVPRLATANEVYNGVESTLVIYANPSDTSKVLAVLYEAPCAATNYRVLDQALVAK